MREPVPPIRRVDVLLVVAVVLTAVVAVIAFGGAFLYAVLVAV
jgi:hypothetical protein